MTFSQILKRLREEAGLTQAALAERTGISLRTLHSWEQGRRVPVSPDFFKLVRGLGVACEAFAACAAAPPRRKAPTAKKGRPRKV
jgi:transcriptional regulator with XRE-family HTH domain